MGELLRNTVLLAVAGFGLLAFNALLHHLIIGSGWRRRTRWPRS